MSAIYLDHQASTPLDDAVLEAMLRAGYGNPSSSEHSFGWAAAEKIEYARHQVASLIGANADEIIFTSGATESNNLAILGMRNRAKQGKCEVIRTSIEHKSVISACDALSEFGFYVREVGVDASGSVSIESLSSAVTERTALISVVLVNNEIGAIQDMDSVKLNSRGAVVHFDAAQAPEAIDMSRTADFCSMISLSAHKMGGPMGVGALYIARELQPTISPILFGGGQQQGIRPGTLPLPLCVGMGEACELAQKHGAGKRAKISRMRAQLLDNLRTGGLAFELNGPKDLMLRHPGNANIRIHGADAEQLLSMLQPRVAASTGSACTSGSLEPSHVLTAIGHSREEAASSIRFSIGRTTTDQDIARASEAILDAFARLV